MGPSAFWFRLCVVNDRRFGSTICGLAVIALGVSAAQAEIVGITARVQTTVQELIDGEPGSVSQDDGQHAQGADDLPQAASVELIDSDLDGELIAVGQAFSEFSDPTRSDTANPAEFALEVAAFSDVESVSYFARGEASESREIVFAGPGGGETSEIAFGADGTRRIESRVFVSGAVLVWSTQRAVATQSRLADVRVTVRRDGEQDSLFETRLLVSAGRDGRIDVTVDGPLRFEVVELLDILSEDADASTVNQLHQLTDHGTIALVVIPDQEHAYGYTAVADESFVLTADFAIEVENVPDGSGVAAALGRSFENLADVVGAIPGVNGLTVERSIREAVKARAIGLVREEPVSRRVGGMCGALGVEALTLGLLPLLLAFASWKRRPPPTFRP